MAEGDILHILIKGESGSTVALQLMGEGSLETVPDAPVALDATDLTSSGFTANWEYLENAEGFYFDLATDPDMTPKVLGYEDLDVGLTDHLDLTGLDSGVTYYYQLRAYNQAGISDYSNIIYAIVIPLAPLIDLDSNEYTTIAIGDQEWTVQNLRVTQYADGTPIPNITENVVDDWFLPSLDELDAIYTNLQDAGIVDYKTHIAPEYDYFPSSSEHGATGCYWQRFDTGEQMTDPAYEISKASEVQEYIPCRTFVSASVLSLGDVGEAGGYVFYIVDNGDGTYTYYEASPVKIIADFPYSKWSNVNLLIGTGTAIGTGQANTAAIIGQAGHTESAAKLCDDLEGGGWPNDTNGAYCWYNNDIGYKDPYGALYNWYAVDNAHGLVYFERNGIEETGWRIPSRYDFDELINYVGGLLGNGGKLKETGLDHWYPPNTGATDEYGFKALPGGIREDAGALGWLFLDLTGYAYFYSSEDTATPDSLGLHYASDNFTYFGFSKAHGLSVRCVRDISAGTNYVEFTDGVTLFRKGVRSHSLVLDKALTATGFDGAEGVDWKNVKEI